MTQRIRRGALACCAVLAALVGMAVFAGPSSAAYSFELENATAKTWHSGTYYCTGNHGTPTAGNATAYGCLKPEGDLLEIADVAKDGKRVGMQWSTDYGRHGLCVNPYGKDFYFYSSGHFPAGKHACQKNFAENHFVTFRVGTCDANKVNCSVLANWGEWSDYVKLKD